MDGGKPRRVRLDFPNLLARELAQAEQAVGVAAFPEIFEPGQFLLGSGDDNFPANFVRDAMFAAERDHLPESADAQPRFFRTGFVIKTGVKHAAVVAGLVRRQRGFFFQQQEARIGSRFQQAKAGGQSDNAAADDDDVMGHGRLCSINKPRRARIFCCGDQTLTSATAFPSLNCTWKL